VPVIAQPTATTTAPIPAQSGGPTASVLSGSPADTLARCATSSSGGGGGSRSAVARLLAAAAQAAGRLPLGPTAFRFRFFPFGQPNVAAAAAAAPTTQPGAASESEFAGRAGGEAHMSHPVFAREARARTRRRAAPAHFRCATT